MCWNLCEVQGFEIAADLEILEHEWVRHVVAFAEVHCRERWSCRSKWCGVWWVGDLEWLFATFWMFCVEALEAVVCRSAYVLVWCVVGAFGNERSAWSLLCERPLEGHDYSLAWSRFRLVWCSMGLVTFEEFLKFVSAFPQLPAYLNTKWLAI